VSFVNKKSAIVMEGVDRYYDVHNENPARKPLPAENPRHYF